MIKRKIYVFTAGVMALGILTGWGGTGHIKINYHSVIFFPSDIAHLASAWQSGLTSHASDADNRKSSDPSEDIKHYIDIDDYPEYISTGRIEQDFGKIAAKHGLTFVQKTGTLPWATVNSFDSLKAQLKRKDFNRALLTAADLGHYVGDGHMPLHITRNYNGQYSGQTGIHSRYESTMISKYQNALAFNADTVSYISDVYDYIFNYIYYNYAYCDSLFRADNAAYAASGSRSNDAYYLALWNNTGRFTSKLFNGAAKSMAALIYTAWCDAGKPQMSTGFKDRLNEAVSGFELLQNYPNPFNPETVITFAIPFSGEVTVSVFDITGKEKEILNKSILPSGTHSVKFDGAGLPGGIYFYRIRFGSRQITKKMVMIK